MQCVWNPCGNSVENVEKRIVMIKILDKGVAEKIAAGEVVERPLSIVKELVENSVDAGADSIVTEIKNGGKSYIRVTDNGCGIPADEVRLAFMRHATSKIYTDSDLDGIKTLGFRGEALASVAAVSKCELLTKPKGAKTGVRIILEGSEVIGLDPFGCPDGTTVVVTNLFYNTPARHKFIKPDTAEASLIIDFVSKMAVAYPGTKIRLINNGNTLFSTRGNGDVLNAILTVYSSETGKRLLPVSAVADFSLSGYISPPDVTRSNRKTQIIFVNGRLISSKVIDKGISDAYSARLQGGRFPICFLFLEVPPESLDVNIHPNKKEVKFADEKSVTSFMENALRKTLDSKDAVPEIKRENIFRFKSGDLVDPEQNLYEYEKSRLEHIKVDIKNISSTFSGENKQIDIKNLLSTIRKADYINENTASFDISDSDSDNQGMPVASDSPKGFDINELTVTGSVFASYITAVCEDSFYFFDQHAAHERILYEQLLKQFESEEKPQQMLMTPFVVNVSFAIKDETSPGTKALRRFGFDIEQFGANAYIVKAVPMFMDTENADGFIEHILENTDEAMDFKSHAVVGRIIADACKLAVKAKSGLSRAEAEKLLVDLSECENPYNCPHGRPSFIKLTKKELEKMFKRS